MQLTQEQKKILQQKLETLWPNPEPCLVCKKREWGSANIIFELREFNKGDLSSGGSIYPVIPITCHNCGYTVFFNALILGIIEPPSDKPAIKELEQHQELNNELNNPKTEMESNG